jgi:methylated-DNA-protein-cysteine methyltransferase-like protein
MPLYEQIYEIVRNIPSGKVATYGQIAKIVGECSARMVGYAMAALSDGKHADVPWQRVINAKGQISMQGFGNYEQRLRLEGESVVFDANDRINFEKYGWVP